MLNEKQWETLFSLLEKVTEGDGAENERIEQFKEKAKENAFDLENFASYVTD